MQTCKKYFSMNILICFMLCIVFTGCDDPCDPDPCNDITNALSGSCMESDDPPGYACECEEGYAWDGGYETCYDLYPCDPDPCTDVTNAVAGTCAESEDLLTYSCECQEGFEWNNNTLECNEIDPCDPDPCSDIPNAIADTCSPSGYYDYTCECADTYAWDGQSNTCKKSSLGELCGYCDGTYCLKGGTGVCPGSDLDMPCLGTAAGMHCSQTCETDADCYNSNVEMTCLTSCPSVENSTFFSSEGIINVCWEADNAAWMESVVCPDDRVVSLEKKKDQKTFHVK